MMIFNYMLKLIMTHPNLIKEENTKKGFRL